MKRFGMLWLIAAVGPVGLATAAPGYSECPGVGQATGCNILITINADLSTTVGLDGSQRAYGGLDDSLIGVLNNSSNPIESLLLLGSRIFAFDSNGMCSIAPGIAGNCSQGVNQDDPYDYAGDFVAFSITDLSHGTVNFINGLGPGASTYFSLEGFPAAGISVGSPTAAQPSSGVPEPATYALLTGGFCLLVGVFRLASVHIVTCNASSQKRSGRNRSSINNSFKSLLETY